MQRSKQRMACLSSSCALHIQSVIFDATICLLRRACACGPMTSFFFPHFLTHLSRPMTSRTPTPTSANADAIAASLCMGHEEKQGQGMGLSCLDVAGPTRSSRAMQQLLSLTVQADLARLASSRWVQSPKQRRMHHDLMRQVATSCTHMLAAQEGVGL